VVVGGLAAGSVDDGGLAVGLDVSIPDEGGFFALEGEDVFGSGKN